jgi:hypothetical protein
MKNREMKKWKNLELALLINWLTDQLVNWSTGQPTSYYKQFKKKETVF